MTARFVERTTNDARDVEGVILNHMPQAVRQCPDCQVAQVQGREEQGYIANGPYAGVHTVRRCIYYDVEPCSKHHKQVEASADFVD